MINCKRCGRENLDDSRFCAYCGHEVEDLNAKVTLGEKVKVVLISFIFSPVGLYWFFKYIKSQSSGKRQLAVVALVLTIVSLGFAIYTIKEYLSAVSTYTNIYQNVYFGQPLDL